MCGVIYGIDGYVVTSALDHHAASNPLTKEVARVAGAWMVNFNNAPILWLVPTSVVLPLLTILTSRMEKGAWAFVFFTDVSLHHPDGWYRNVPVCDAIQHHDERKSDHGMQQVLN